MTAVEQNLRDAIVAAGYPADALFNFGGENYLVPNGDDSYIGISWFGVRVGQEVRCYEFTNSSLMGEIVTRIKHSQPKYIMHLPGLTNG